MTTQTPTRIATDIRRMIHDGTLPGHSLIGSEAGLAERYGVAPGVVNEAVDMLRTNGLVVQRPGGGIYVDVDATVLPDGPPVTCWVTTHPATPGSLSVTLRGRWYATPTPDRPPALVVLDIDDWTQSDRFSAPRPVSCGPVVPGVIVHRWPADPVPGDRCLCREHVLPIPGPPPVDDRRCPSQGTWSAARR